MTIQELRREKQLILQEYSTEDAIYKSAEIGFRLEIIDILINVARMFGVRRIVEDQEIERLINK